MTKEIDAELKVGDIIRNIYHNFEGVVLDVWDGKYTCFHYAIEQFNPYRITVQYGQDYIEKFGVGLGNGTVMQRVEYLEKV